MIAVIRIAGILSHHATVGVKIMNLDDDDDDDDYVCLCWCM